MPPRRAVVVAPGRSKRDDLAARSPTGPFLIRRRPASPDTHGGRMWETHSMTRTIKTPGPGHPITISPHEGRVTVTVAGRVVAESRSALSLQEAAYPAVFYLPREDADMTLFEASPHTTYCPYKGDCSYFSIPIGGERSADAVWSYGAPYPAVASISGHLAFYPNRVDGIEIASA